MALVLSGERLGAAAASTSPLKAIVVWFAKFSAARSQRQALDSLLDLDGSRLDDLGISRGDLFDALRAEHRPTRLLAERRSFHAAGWPHHNS